MRLKHNIDMVLANLVQQITGTIAILLIPKFLSPDEYGKITTIAVLLAFAPLCDLGISNVYTRKMPALLAQGESAAVSAWNATTLWMKIVGSVIFGLILGGLYEWKYGETLTSISIVAITFLTTITTYFVSWNTVRSDFAAVKTITILQAILRLLTIPGAAFIGVFGWCSAQIIAALGLTIRGDIRHWFRVNLHNSPFCLKLVKDNIPEALQLVLLTNFWVQMLSFGRSYAALSYPDAITAQYGLVNAALQAITSVCIAAFSPQTIKVYSLLALDREQALQFVIRTISWTMPVMVLGSIASIQLLPIFFKMAFPTYNIPDQLIAFSMLSLISYPIIMSLGSLLIGSGRSAIYLATVLAGLAVAFTSATTLFGTFAYDTAALAQLIAVSGFVGLLILVISICFSEFSKQLVPLWIAGGVCGLVPALYLLTTQ